MVLLSKKTSLTDDQGGRGFFQLQLVLQRIRACTHGYTVLDQARPSLRRAVVVIHDVSYVKESEPLLLQSAVGLFVCRNCTKFATALPCAPSNAPAKVEVDWRSGS